MSLSRRELFEIWCKEDMLHKNSAVLSHVLNKLYLNEHAEDPHYQHVKKIVANLNSNFADKWKKCSRSLQVFIMRHTKWLDNKVAFTLARKVGRPSRKFADVSSETKRWRTSSLVENYSSEELSFATSTSFRKAGKRDAALMVKTVSHQQHHQLLLNIQ